MHEPGNLVVTCYPSVEKMTRDSVLFSSYFAKSDTMILKSMFRLDIGEVCIVISSINDANYVLTSKKPGWTRERYLSCDEDQHR
jgi:hypothetical protein